MEAVEGPPLEDIAAEGVKLSDVSCEASTDTVTSVQYDVCHKSNGMPDAKDFDQDQPSVDDEGIPEHVNPSGIAVEEQDSVENIVTENETTVTEVATNSEESINISSEATKAVALNKTEQQDNSQLQIDNDDDVHPAFEVEVDGIVETVSENVRFETEILIETNVDEQSSKYQIIYSDTDEPEHSKNILSELGQNIELSDMLRSSDVSENVENNNCEVTQEVFNKEELLDILEGNDVEETRKVISDNFASDCKKLETQLALQQLSRLKQGKKSRLTPKKPDSKSSKKSESPKKESVKKKSSTRKEDNNSQTKSTQKEDNSTKTNATQKEDQHSKTNNLQDEDNIAKPNSTQKEENTLKNNSTQKDNSSSSKTNSTLKDSGNLQNNSDAEPKKESIVTALVKDWEDDEPPEGAQRQMVEQCEDLVGESEEIIKSQDTAVNESNISIAEVSLSDVATPNIKSESESRPQRRVIKKKVIFDPDNPDTFTKSKMAIKKDQSDKDQKEQPTPKKIKTDPTSPRSKSKSPTQSKLQWKKPQPKTIKPGKRLTEIDRLLMDEGAVNMICQLTPEAPKGHKNMKSKAEFIKKIQSSTPEGKEMKFRERKKELKFEEGDPKRIGSGKERLSLSSSVKSPTVSEDFEAHSADDSIIYRRHSSSSYSSPCMSPRRLSDVEIINQNALAISQAVAPEGQPQDGVLIGSDVFMSENTGTLATGVINKKDLLSIKEKLNSKLSQALNKRKRDSTKAEKPSKIKKVSKSIEKLAFEGEYKYVKLIYDQKLAEICITDLSQSVYNIEVMNELKTVLEIVDSKKDFSVTLLTAESGILCSGLELKPLLDQETGASYAQVLAESARSLLCTLEAHSKLVCVGVENRCHALGLSLVALSDISVASENASFGLSANKDALLQPGAASLTARGLPQSILNEIIVFDRPISAAEALRGGLVSRTVWPERFKEQVRAIAKDIAAQPTENVMLKKQLLRLKRGGSQSILASLETERDLFVKYWTSAEGLELVRASLDPVKE